MWRSFEYNELFVILKKPVKNYLNFVTWFCDISCGNQPLDVYTVVIKQWTGLAAIPVKAVVFKQYSIGAKWLKVC